MEKEQLYYGALLHDIGMLAVPNLITGAPRSLTSEEYEKVKMHVHRAERVLKNRMADEVVEIVAAHHERCDGSGYPRGLKEIQMNKSQQIVQFADAVNALMGSKAYRPAFKDEEILELIRKETVAGKYNKAISKIFFDCYNEIMEYVSVRAEETMSTYKKLNQQYSQVSEKLKER